MLIPESLRQRLPKRKSKDDLAKHYNEMEKIELEKGDFLAMVIAAFITFMPVVIIALIVIFGLMWLLA